MTREFFTDKVISYGSQRKCLEYCVKNVILLRYMQGNVMGENEFAACLYINSFFWVMR